MGWQSKHGRAAMREGRILFAIGFILVAVIALTIWYGCDREGSLSPTESSLAQYVYLDTLYASGLYAAPEQDVTITACVRSEDGEPAAAYDVRFTTTLGTFPGGEQEIIQPSGSQGLAQTILSTTVEDTGNALITAMLLASQETQSLTIAVGDTSILIPGEGQLYMWSTYSSLYADNGQSSTPIFARLRDQENHPMGGESIQFTTTLGTIMSPGITNDSTGVAQVTLYSSVNPGIATVTASYGLVTDSIQVQFLLIPGASSITLAASPSLLIANGFESSQLRATVLNIDGNPVANGTQVTFRSNYGILTEGAPVGSAPREQTGPVRSKTEAQTFQIHRPGEPPRPMGTESVFTTVTYGGVATATLTSATIAIRDTITAEVGAISASTTVLYIPGPAALILVEPQETSLPADGYSSCLVDIAVFDAFQNPAAAGEIVTVEAVLGIVNPATGITDGQGHTSTAFTAGTQAGTASVIATSGSAQGSESILLVQVPLDTLWILMTPSSVLGDGESSAEVRATLFGENGYVVPGTIVNFELDHNVGYLSAAQAVTDSTGVARTTYYGIATVADENVTVHAWTNGNDAQGSRNFVLRGITFTGWSVPTTIVADGVSTSEITVRLRETTSFVALNDRTVTFGSSLGTIPNQGITNSSGLVTTTLTSGTEPGLASVVAAFGSTLYDTISVTLMESSPTYLSLTANPTVILADNASISTLTAVLTDQSNNPVPDGTVVRFDVPPNSGSLENSVPTIGGVALNMLTSSSTPDTVLIRAWAETAPNVRDSTTVIYTVGSPQTILLSAQFDTLLANGIATDTITALVQDAVGHALRNIEVLFETTRGNITNSQQTNIQGIARVPFSSLTTGVATITATAGTATAQTTVYLVPGAANSIILSYDPSSVGVQGSGRNETLMITADVRDASNNPVLDGTLVTYDIYASPGGGDFLSSYDPIPTINGQASVSYNSGTISGSVRIIAACGSIQAISTEIQIFSGPPFIENVNNGCLSSHLAIGANPINFYGWYTVNYSTTITAVVGDRYNNPVPAGTAVYFTTSGGVINTMTGYTDSSGVATVTMLSGAPYPTIARWFSAIHDPNTGGQIECNEAPTQNGVAMVMASSEGVDSSGNPAIAWGVTNVIFSGPIDSMYVASATVNGDPNLRELYIGDAAIIVFRLFDVNHHPVVPGSEINSTASAGMIYPGTITTNDPGQIQYTVSFFNNLTANDDPVATPVLISVDCTNGSAYLFTDTFMLYNTQQP